MNIKTDLETIIEILQISKEDLANDLKMSRQMRKYSYSSADACGNSSMSTTKITIVII